MTCVCAVFFAFFSDSGIYLCIAEELRTQRNRCYTPLFTKEESCGEYSLSFANVFEFEAVDCWGFIYSTEVLLPLSFASPSRSEH
jgi:hypothetical protein